MKIEEVWKDIDGYPNYQVSNLGNVKSKERYTKQRNGINLRKEKLDMWLKEVDKEVE